MSIKNKNFYDKTIICSLILILFIGFGTIIIIAGVNKYKTYKLCTYTVKAYCTSIKENLNDKDDVVDCIPCYSYTYNKKSYKNIESAVRTLDNLKIGYEYNIKINPSKPTQITDGSELNTINALICTGILSIFIGIFIVHRIVKYKKDNKIIYNF